MDFGNAFRQFAEHVSPVQASMRKRMLAVSLGIMRDDFSIPFELKKITRKEIIATPTNRATTALRAGIAGPATTSGEVPAAGH